MVDFADFWDLPRGSRLFYLLGTARLITIICGVGILFIMHRQKKLARLGSVRAARALLLPIYEPMIVMLVVSLCVSWVFLYLEHIQEALLAMNLASYTLDSFTTTGLVLFFCSHSLSEASKLRSLFWSFCWSVIGFACAIVHELYSPLIGELLYHLLPVGLMIVILRKHVYRRRSVVPAVQFMILYRLIWASYTIFTEQVNNHMGYLLSLMLLGIMEVPLCVLWYFTMVC
jgi:hypothetical protein